MTYVPVSTMWELQRLHEGSLDIGLFGSGGTIVVRVGWSTVCTIIVRQLTEYRAPRTWNSQKNAAQSAEPVATSNFPTASLT